MNIQELSEATDLIKQELEPLAQKLGEGAEYTFGLFVRQVYVSAITGLLWIPFGLAGLWICKIIYDKQKRESQKKYSDVETMMFAWIGIIGIGFISMFFVLFPISSLIQAIVNPEYQAIKLIIETINPVN